MIHVQSLTGKDNINYNDSVVDPLISIQNNGSLQELMIANYNYTDVKVRPLPEKQRLFLAVLQATSKSCNHCICIDGSRKLMF